MLSIDHISTQKYDSLISFFILFLFLNTWFIAQVARWNVGKITADKFPQLNGTILLNSHTNPSGTSSNTTSSGLSLGPSASSTGGSHVISESNVAPVIEMHWKVPMASVSGLAVSSLQMTNERYKPYKGVRAVAKSGKFLIRSV